MTFANGGVQDRSYERKCEEVVEPTGLSDMSFQRSRHVFKPNRGTEWRELFLAPAFYI